jgi:hypothetical protein
VFSYSLEDNHAHCAFARALSPDSRLFSDRLAIGLHIMAPQAERRTVTCATLGWKAKDEARWDREDLVAETRKMVKDGNWDV